MNGLVESFRNGGWGMYPTVIFGVALVAVALRYAIRPKSRQIPLIASLGVVTFTSGALGCVSGMIVTAEAFAEMPEGGRTARIPFLGFGESLNNVAFALALITIAALAVSLGTWRTADREALAT